MQISLPLLSGKRMRLALPELFLATVLYAHTYPITPIEMDLRAYPGMIRVLMESNQCYWVAEVLGESVPPLVWTDAQKAVLEKYLDTHFLLMLDGKSLKSHVQKARTAQDPWESPLKGRAYFTVLYDLPPAEGRMLRGHAVFYKEFMDHLKATREPLDSSRVPQEFVTHLRIVGPSTHRFSLTLDKPDFELPLAEATRAPWRVKIDLWIAFLKDIARDAAFGGWLVLVIGLFVYYRNRPKEGSRS